MTSTLVHDALTAESLNMIAECRRVIGNRKRWRNSHLNSDFVAYDSAIAHARSIGASDDQIQMAIQFGKEVFEGVSAPNR